MCAYAYLLIACLVSTASLAQEDKTFKDNKGKLFAGIQAGPALYTVIPHENPYAMSIQAQMGYLAGVSGQFQLHPRFSVHHEINYGTIAYMLLYDHPAPDQVKMIRVKDECLYIPAMIRLYAIKGKTNFFIEAGLFSSFILKETRVSTYRNNTQKTFVYVHADDNSWAGACGGLGIDSQLSEQLHLFVDARDHIPYTKSGDLIQLPSLHIGVSYKF